MKKIILILIAALMLTGCTEKSALFGAGSSSVKKLTGEQADAYQFFAQSIGSDPVEITDSEVINELWVYLSECEDGERCRFSEGCEPAGVNSDTDTLILKDKSSGAEYSIAAGYPFRSTNTKDDEPVIRISGYINEDELLWAAYKDVHGNFETLLDGLAERASGSTEPPALLTDNALEDYEITGSIDVYDHESNTYTKYSGAVSEEVTGELWELLCVIDRGSPILLEGRQTVGGGCIGGGLVFRNKNTGEGYWVSDGILYAAPELDGGTSVLVIGGRYYGDGYLEEYGVTASKKIEELLIKGVAREENVVERIVYEPSDPWKDKPEKLTDMIFEELEFSGKANVYDHETSITTTYQGDITGDVRAELWELLGEIEECDPVELGEKGSVGGGCFNGALWITNAVTGDEYVIFDGIYYSNPMLEGGPEVVAIMGRFRDGSDVKYYYPDYDENGVSLFDKLTDTLCGALVCEENVYVRVQTYPQNAPEFPEKLTALNFGDLEFTGEAEVYEAYTTTKYRGKIDGDTAEKLWALLKVIEDSTPFDYDDNDYAGGYGSRLLIKDRSTGKSYTVSDGILYDNPMDCGGASVFIIDGIPYGGLGYICYSSYRFNGSDNGTSLDYEFSDLLTESVVREENVISREYSEEYPPKEDIVYVRSYRNWAWGHQHYGTFVDMLGNVYEFDFSDNETSSDEEFVELLEKWHFNHLFGKPVGKIDDLNALAEIVELADQVSEDAKIVKKLEAYDAGQRTIYALNSRHSLVEISSYGDYRRINTDPNAIKIAVICEANKIS